MDNTSRRELRRFIACFKNETQAAKAAGVTRQRLNYLKTAGPGESVGVKVALAMEQVTNGKVTKEKLIFGDHAQTGDRVKVAEQ